MGKHTTYRGIDIDHYKMMRSSMSSEAFAKWVHTVTGKPRLITDRPITISFWAKKSDTIAFHTVQRIYELESKSWLSRLFNLKG